jgi:hypothetical protein
MIMRVVIVLALVLLISGCLEREVTEFRVLRLGGDPAIFEWEESNFYSSEKGPAEIRKDFDSMIENSRVEHVVDDAKKEGVSIKECDLFVRDGKVVFRMTGIVPDLSASFSELQVTGSQIIWTIDTNEDDKVETNGKIVSNDPVKVAWDRNAPMLQVRIRKALRPTYAATQPVFVQMLKDYEAARAK